MSFPPPTEHADVICPRRRVAPLHELAASDAPLAISRAKRAVFLTLAGVFFGLAALGAVLPVLPSTPFILLTSYFLLRCSPQLNERLLRSRLLGPLLRDWQERGGVARKVKYRAILLVGAAIGLTLFLAPLPRYAQIAASVLAVVGIMVVASLPEPREE